MQPDINDILLSLHELLKQIEDVRKKLVFLQDNFEKAKREYYSTCRPFEREKDRLIYEISELIQGKVEVQDKEESIPNMGNDQGGKEKGIIDKQLIEAEYGSSIVSWEDPEALEKDRFREHLTWVLDPEMGGEGEAIVTHLQDLIDDQSIKLGAVLEQCPWGAIWVNRSPHESLLSQYERLSVWEIALKERLSVLNDRVESLKKGLGQKRQEGPDAWRLFLEKVTYRYQEDIEDLRYEISRLRGEGV